jgi:phenylacetate-CoA ligase
MITDKVLQIDQDISLEQFRALPILTKQIVRDHLDNIKSQDPSLKGVFRNMTGGSTGTPLVFYQDINYKSAALAREWGLLKWWGIKPGDRTTAFWGADREIHLWSQRERFMMWMNRENIFDSFAMSEDKMASFAMTLMRWNPVYIKGYASSLHLFARFLLANKQFQIRPKAIRSTAETLFGHQRKDIEEAFDCKVYNFYGSREVNNIAAECHYQKGLHVFSGTRIVEVVNGKGEPADPGEIGRIVVTDLVNRAMPFIRYENGDLGVWSEIECPCGRPYPLLKQIVGRVSDILVGDKGQYIHGEFITHLFYDLTGILNFQVIQKDRHNLEILVCRDKSVRDVNLEPICRRIKERLGPLEIVVRDIDAFERNSSGKHRFIISDISPFANDRESADNSGN